MCKCNKENIKLNDIKSEDIKDVEEFSEIDEAIEFLGLEEEIKRIEKQDKPLDLSSIPQYILDREGFKDILEEAYAVGAAVKILMDCGIDYNNAVNIANNSSVAMANRKLQKITNIQLQSQMP